MYLLFFSITVATILTQIPNLLGVNNAQNLTFLYALKISLITLPITFFATALYTIFYGKGAIYFSYPSLAIIAKVFALLSALIINVYIIKTKSVNIVEVFGFIIALIGTFLIIYNEKINNFINQLSN